MESSHFAQHQRIRFLLNHITGYSDIIRTDALLLKNEAIAEHFRHIFSEAIEIKRIAVQSFPSKPDDSLLISVVREEVARHLYVIMYLVIQLQKDFDPESYKIFDYEIHVIRNAVTELVVIFENLLNIAPEEFEHIPIQDMQQSSLENLSDYFSIPQVGDTSKNVDSGDIIFVGQSGRLIQKMHDLFQTKGYQILILEDTSTLLESLSLYDVNLVCLDADSSYFNVEETVLALADNALFHDIPLIVVSDEDNRKAHVRFLSIGVLDFVTFSTDMELVEARVQSAIAYCKSNFRRKLYIRALEMNKYRMSKEFSSAVSYVSALLPKPFKSSSLAVDWTFLPSLDLGGDVFGYQWISEQDFAIFLVDVSGHGLEASLFSVTVMNLLEKKLLKHANFCDPASVLSELNDIFRIEEQHNMYFTAWYGVYNTATRLLTYSSGGSQPAILYPPVSPPEKLTTDGLIIGVDPDSEYDNAVRFIPPGARLYLFSDGIFEIRKRTDTMMNLAEFIQILGVRNPSGESCRAFVGRIEAMSKTGEFDDDVSLIELSFFD